MADKKDDKNEKQDEKAEKKDTAQPAGKIGMLTWIIMAAVILVLGGSGFVLGRLFANPGSPKAAEPTSENTQTEETGQAVSDANNSSTWYYNDLESIVVNPDEPGATRFVRVGLILEISSELDQEKAKELINAKKPPLINWINLYFKSLTLDQMRTDRDIKRIQTEIMDAFNEMLFPKGKPHIKKVLIREFNIQ